MHSTALKKMELMQKIAKLSDQKLDKIESFLHELYPEDEFQPAKPMSLQGIWKNKGFEKVIGLESEIVKVRKELDDAILQKEL